MDNKIKSVNDELSELNDNLKVIKEIDSNKEILLLTEQNPHKKLKEILNWNDEEKLATKKLSENLEIKAVIDKYGIGVSSEEKLMLFCIKNNYIVTSLRNYKGPTPDILLDSINKVLIENDINAEYAADNLYILTPFSYVRQYETEKQIKRRKEKELKELIILQKIDERHSSNSEVYYKPLMTLGKINRVEAFFKSLFATHPKQQNYINNTLMYIIGLLLYTLITVIGSDNYSGLLIFTKLVMFVTLICLIIKAFIPDTKFDLSVNVENTENFTKWPENDNYNSTYSRYFKNLYYRYCESDFFNFKSIEEIIKKYYQTVILCLATYLVYLVLIYKLIILLGVLRNNTIKIDDNCKSEKNSEFITNEYAVRNPHSLSYKVIQVRQKNPDYEKPEKK